MSEEAAKCNVKTEQLRGYGLPEKLIGAFERMAQSGVFDEVVPDALLAESLERTLPLLPESDGPKPSGNT